MPCHICGLNEVSGDGSSAGWHYDCPRCGRYRVYLNKGNVHVPGDKRAVASYLVRKLQTDDKTYFPELTEEFFASLKDRSLPSPAEMMDNFILWIAQRVDSQPGKYMPVVFSDPCLCSNIGAVDSTDVHWVINELNASGMYKASFERGGCSGALTCAGWKRVEELRLARVDSGYAFFARKFENTELDNVFDHCLKQAVKATGYELRTVTQKAGHIDAIIEDEIRRCKFLIADLTDHNNGAYWEAGFAEGLGKPVIYICKEDVETHFDTSHRQTIKWGKKPFKDVAKELKAVIRNTLLGDAKQSDD